MIPARIDNVIDGRERPAADGERFPKLSPVDGRELCTAARSRAADVAAAVAAARAAQPAWAARTAVERGDLLRAGALALRERLEDVARVVHLETGKSLKDARGETSAAIEMGLFVAGEGRRLYGRTTTSAVPHRQALTLRQPVGVAGLIVPANTPIANVAWKAFPALLCGNAAVLKSSEDAPATAALFGRLLHEAGLPAGVLNTLHGLGPEAGAPLVEHAGVDLVSFTGSAEVGRGIAVAAGRRLARTCLELGGKNALVVCDDAELERAADVAVLSAFSNAGQRCAAASRLIVFESVYEPFRRALLERTRALRVGPSDEDDLGPVINETQLRAMLQAVQAATGRGARVAIGGTRLTDAGRAAGCYMAPTVLEELPPGDPLSACELFGPITVLHRVPDFEAALALANDSPFGLTAAIHTRDVNRALVFMNRVRTGVVSVNGATYGSEPHLPFGGLGLSGNGTREAGTEALDVYSEWKTVYLHSAPGET